MTNALRIPVVALIALSSIAMMTACSATKSSSTPSLIQTPGQAHSLADVRVGPAVVGFNSDNGTLEAWPIGPGGGQQPQELTGTLGFGTVTGMAANGQAVAMASQFPPAVEVYHIPSKTLRTLDDPFGVPDDIAIDKSQNIFVSNVNKNAGNVTMFPPQSGRAVDLDCTLIGVPEGIAVDDEGDVFVNGFVRHSFVEAVVEIPAGPNGPEPQNCVKLQLKNEVGVAGVAIDPKSDDLVTLDNPDECAGGIEGRMTIYPKPYSKATGFSRGLGANCAGSIRISADSTRVFVGDEDVSGSIFFILQRSFPNGSFMGEYDNGQASAFTTLPNVLPN